VIIEYRSPKFVPNALSIPAKRAFGRLVRSINEQPYMKAVYQHLSRRLARSGTLTQSGDQPQVDLSQQFPLESGVDGSQDHVIILEILHLGVGCVVLDMVDNVLVVVGINVGAHAEGCGTVVM